jgi:hypothetical protein
MRSQLLQSLHIRSCTHQHLRTLCVRHPVDLSGDFDRGSTCVMVTPYAVHSPDGVRTECELRAWLSKLCRCKELNPQLSLKSERHRKSTAATPQTYLR